MPYGNATIPLMSANARKRAPADRTDAPMSCVHRTVPEESMETNAVSPVSTTPPSAAAEITCPMHAGMFGSVHVQETPAGVTFSMLNGPVHAPSWPEIKTLPSTPPVLLYPWDAEMAAP